MRPFAGEKAVQIAQANFLFDPANSTANAFHLGRPLADLVIYCATQHAFQALRGNNATPVYVYYSKLVGKNSFFNLLNLGATHTSEIPFFLNAPSVFGFNFTAIEKEYASQVVSQHVLHFAAHGAPMPSWTPMETFVFAVDENARIPPAARNCSIWDPVFNQ